MSRVAVPGNARKREDDRNIRSMLAGDPIENPGGCDGFLWRMWVQGAGDRAPALLDDLLGELLGLGFRLELPGRANRPALLMLALGHDVGTVGNVPDIRVGQANSLEHVQHAFLPQKATCLPLYSLKNFAVSFIELRQERP